MELEEAKEILNNILKGYHYIGGRVNKEKLALKVVLQTLENSVSKDVIREKIKELEYCQSKCITFEGGQIMENKIQVLQELLK